MKHGSDSAIVATGRQRLEASDCVIAVSLLALAALLRFNDLGDLGFYGDEETTAYAARAVAEGEAPHMPSGMPYQRALPYSWLAGLTARYLGTDEELAYRFPAAVAGSLTAPVLFLLALPLIGRRAAFFAALLLDLSEWHVLTSREARMYAPFLLFFTASGLFALRWSASGAKRHVLGALACAVAAMTFQPLAAFASLAFVVPLVVTATNAVSPGRAMMAALAVAAACLAYTQLVELPPYAAWKALHDVSRSGPTSTTPWWQPGGLSLSALEIAGAVVGLLVGLASGSLLARNGLPPRSWIIRLAVVLAAAATGAMVGMGQFYGAALFVLILLLVDGRTVPELVRRTWLLLVILAVLGTGALALHFTSSASVYGALRASVALPFPYLAYFADLFPGLIAMLIAIATVAAFRRGVLAEHRTARVFGLLTLLPIAAMGLVSQWGGIRYLLACYPFMLLTAAVALDSLGGLLAARIPRWRHEQITWLLGTSVIASGLLGGHGVPQALRAMNLTYGPVAAPLALGFDIYPDHQGAGRFVAARLRTDDLVVAEDSLEQRWYVGRVDYWLLNEIASAPFLYRNADGYLRDIYVNSAAATPEVLEELTAETARRIWVITSAETHGRLDYYLTDAQRRWLDVVQRQAPAYAGADGVTRVYCINCEQSP
jgi:hypothetical protein